MKAPTSWFNETKEHIEKMFKIYHPENFKTPDDFKNLGSVGWKYVLKQLNKIELFKAHWDTSVECAEALSHMPVNYRPRDERQDLIAVFASLCEKMPVILDRLLEINESVYKNMLENDQFGILQGIASVIGARYGVCEIVRNYRWNKAEILGLGHKKNAVRTLREYNYPFRDSVFLAVLKEIPKNEKVLDENGKLRNARLYCLKQSEFSYIQHVDVDAYKEDVREFLNLIPQEHHAELMEIKGLKNIFINFYAFSKAGKVNMLKTDENLYDDMTYAYTFKMMTPEIITRYLGACFPLQKSNGSVEKPLPGDIIDNNFILGDREQDSNIKYPSVGYKKMKNDAPLQVSIIETLGIKAVDQDTVEFLPDPVELTREADKVDPNANLTATQTTLIDNSIDQDMVAHEIDADIVYTSLLNAKSGPSFPDLVKAQQEGKIETYRKLRDEYYADLKVMTDKLVKQKLAVSEKENDLIINKAPQTEKLTVKEATKTIFVLDQSFQGLFGSVHKRFYPVVKTEIGTQVKVNGFINLARIRTKE
ncbi:MAG: hypothetical protein LBU87_00355 [Lactobacillales bacterium]|jgi:hypothetical protein|nr:hypothetical protein [Lactobacillales bacterium]